MELITLNTCNLSSIQPTPSVTMFSLPLFCLISLYKSPPNRNTDKKHTDICSNLDPGTDVLSLSKMYFCISMCLSPIHPILPRIVYLFRFMTRCKLSRPETLAAHKCVTLSHSVFNMFVSPQVMSATFPVPFHGIHHENSHRKPLLNLSEIQSNQNPHERCGKEDDDD